LGTHLRSRTQSGVGEGRIGREKPKEKTKLGSFVAPLVRLSGEIYEVGKVNEPEGRAAQTGKGAPKGAITKKGILK